MASSPSWTPKLSLAIMAPLFSTATLIAPKSSVELRFDASPWTICYSLPPSSSAPTRNWVPPSQWDINTLKSLCFLKRSNVPGTALTQHMAADIYTKSVPDWDLSKNFPSISIMSRYPDIGEDEPDNSSSQQSSSELLVTSELRHDPEFSDRSRTELRAQLQQKSSLSAILTSDSLESTQSERKQQKPNGKGSTTSSERSAREYYTLWYTTLLSSSSTKTPDSGFQVNPKSKVKASDRNEEGIVKSKTTERWKRFYLKLHGVNYQPIVYFRGNLTSPYSAFVDAGAGINSYFEANNRFDENFRLGNVAKEKTSVTDRQSVEDVGGMFIRRHYDLGMLPESSSEGLTNEDLPLEILVLPPPIVGKPTLPKISTEATKKGSIGLIDNRAPEQNNEHLNYRDIPAIESINESYFNQSINGQLDKQGDRWSRAKLRNMQQQERPHLSEKSLHQQEQRQQQVLSEQEPLSHPPCQGQTMSQELKEPQGQGGNHNLAQSGPIMQCSAGWDWISHTPDRNTGIWDNVEVEWTWGDVKLEDAWVKVVQVTVDNMSGDEEDDEKNRGNEKVHVNQEDEELPLGQNVFVSAQLDVSISATYHPNVVDGEPIFTPIHGWIDYSIAPYHNPFLSSTVQTALGKMDHDTAILASGAVHNITIDKSVASFDLGTINMPNARLWWPHTHGSQPLYAINVTFRSYEFSQNSEYSKANNDTYNYNNDHPQTASPATQSELEPLHESNIESTFGIRTLSSFTHPQTKSFSIKINGHPIFLQGGNWITTDQFLRFASSNQRYYHELRLLRELGMNSIRIWGGGIAETNAFYSAADALGFIVYQEFWMTGDNNGRYSGSYDWPLDHIRYLKNVEDVVRRLRNHVSLSWYGGGNELLSEQDPNSPGDERESPPEDIEYGIRNYIENLDGTRPYVTSSVSEVGEHFDPTKALGPKDGPYGIIDERRFFERNPGLGSPLLTEDEIKNGVSPRDVANRGEDDLPGRNIGFQTEVGSVSHPDFSSLKNFLSSHALHEFPNCGEQQEKGGSVHAEWSFYKYLPFTEETQTGEEVGDEGGVDHICSFLYPPTTNPNSYAMESIEDYTEAAQLSQYFQYKYLFEGYSHRMFEWYSAVYLWKASSPAPTLRGSLYDWYLETNGGYWGARSALVSDKNTTSDETTDVRIILNLQDWTVHIVNSLPLPILPTSRQGLVSRREDKDVNMIQNGWSINWNAHTVNGTLVGKGQIPISKAQVDGNTVAHLDESLPWLGKETVTITDYGINEVQDVLYYKLGLIFQQGSRPGPPRIVTNAYYLTDPSQNTRSQRQSRFALLGALRKATPKVNLQVNCTVSQNTTSASLRTDCNILNPIDEPGDNFMAVMAKISLRYDLTTQPQDEAHQDARILPTFYSDNYVSLLPGESTDIHISADNVEITTANGAAHNFTCSPNGTVVLSTVGSSAPVKIYISGWNVEERAFLLGCGRPISELSWLHSHLETHWYLPQIAVFLLTTVTLTIALWLP